MSTFFPQVVIFLESVADSFRVPGVPDFDQNPVAYESFHDFVTCAPVDPGPAAERAHRYLRDPPPPSVGHPKDHIQNLPFPARQSVSGQGLKNFVCDRRVAIFFLRIRHISAEVRPYL